MEIKRAWVLGLMLAACGPAVGADAPAPTLDGAWTVDLSTDPAVPYVQPMHLKLLAGGEVEGDFYGSAIEAGRWKVDRDRLCASFRTSDGQGPYHSAVCLVDGMARGQTWAEHRDFLFNWNAARAPRSSSVADQVP